MPGRFVSRRKGRRLRGQSAPRRSSSVRSGPVMMKPWLSIATSPRSHSVCGSAPAIENTCRIACCDVGAVGVIAPRHRLEVVIALERGDVRARVDRDVRRLLDAPDQVPRHVLGEVGAADTARGRARSAATGTTAAWPAELRAADHDDVVGAAALRFDLGRRVVDADALEPFASPGRRAFGIARRSR